MFLIFKLLSRVNRSSLWHHTQGRLALLRALPLEQLPDGNIIISKATCIGPQMGQTVLRYQGEILEKMEASGEEREGNLISFALTLMLL